MIQLAKTYFVDVSVYLTACFLLSSPIPVAGCQEGYIVEHILLRVRIIFDMLMEMIKLHHMDLASVERLMASQGTLYG